MFYVADLIWDERNLGHVSRHNVSRQEVEEVCYADPFVKRARDGLRSGASRSIGTTLRDEIGNLKLVGG